MMSLIDRLAPVLTPVASAAPTLALPQPLSVADWPKPNASPQFLNDYHCVAFIREIVEGLWELNTQPGKPR